MGDLAETAAVVAAAYAMMGRMLQLVTVRQAEAAEIGRLTAGDAVTVAGRVVSVAG